MVGNLRQGRNLWDHTYTAGEAAYNEIKPGAITSQFPEAF